MEPSTLGWEVIMQSWLSTLPPAINDHNKTMIKAMFLRFCPPLLWIIRRGYCKVIDSWFLLLAYGQDQMNYFG